MDGIQCGSCIALGVESLQLDQGRILVQIFDLPGAKHHFSRIQFKFIFTMTDR